MCRIVGITCLSSGALLDMAMCPVSGKGHDEQTLLRTMLKTFENKDILLGDAFYATYFLMAELKERGVDAVFEQHGSRKRRTDFRCGKKLGSKDHLIIITRPKSPPFLDESGKVRFNARDIDGTGIKYQRKNSHDHALLPSFSKQRRP